MEDVACVFSCRHDELMEDGYGVFTKISLGLDSNRTSFDDMQAYFRASSPKEDRAETHSQQTDHTQRLDRLCTNELLRPSMLPKNSSDTGVESRPIVNLVSTSLATRALVPISSVELLDTYKRKPHRIQSRYFEISGLIYVVCMAGLKSSEA